MTQAKSGICRVFSVVKHEIISECLHPQAVIHGQQQSRWLCLFLSARRRRFVQVYLEDDHQLDQVYSYLNELYVTAVASTTCQTKLENTEQVPFFVLDVLFPEVRALTSSLSCFVD